MSEMQKRVPSVVEAIRIDPKFKYEIGKMHGAEKITLCFQCGTCTADCPIARFSDLYKPRKIARIVQLGLKDKILSNDALWLCATCFTCIDHCPQGVEIASVVRALRNLSVRDREIAPLVYKSLASNLLKTGYVYAIPESILKRRQQQGLPPLPKPNLEHIAKIFDATGFSKSLQNMKTFDVARAES